MTSAYLHWDRQDGKKSHIREFRAHHLVCVHVVKAIIFGKFRRERNCSTDYTLRAMGGCVLLVKLTSFRLRYSFFISSQNRLIEKICDDYLLRLWCHIVMRNDIGVICNIEEETGEKEKIQKISQDPNNFRLKTKWHFSWGKAVVQFNIMKAKEWISTN